MPVKSLQGMLSEGDSEQGSCGPAQANDSVSIQGLWDGRDLWIPSGRGMILWINTVGRGLSTSRSRRGAVLL